MLLQAQVANLKSCQAIFDSFGEASGLKCDWTKMAAVYIAPGPIPDELKDFLWQWEEAGNYSKLLGIPFGMGISHVLLVEVLRATLEKKLGKAKHDPHSFMARVMIANMLLEESLWYVLTLWLGSEKELSKFHSSTQIGRSGANFN